MSKRLIHVVVGIVLTGCTINQYGPRITVGDSNSPTVVDVSFEETNQETEAGVTTLPDTSVKPAVHKETKYVHRKPIIHESHVPKKKATCVPMPSIPDPPRVDMEEMKKYKGNDKQLQLLFEQNHADLYRHSKEMKRLMDEWYAKPNRC